MNTHALHSSVEEFTTVHPHLQDEGWTAHHSDMLREGPSVEGTRQPVKEFPSLDPKWATKAYGQ